MTLHHVELARCKPQPWRNGGGLTRELLAWPHAADWVLRVSVAEIERSGPFSAFPDVDRCFAVISGAGVRLALPGGERTLTPGDEPVAFAGEAAPACHLVDGPTHDLNLMLSRKRRAAPSFLDPLGGRAGRSPALGALGNDGLQAQMLSAPAGTEFDGSTRWRGFYAADPALLECDGVAEPVHAGTLVWADDGEASHWAVRHAGRAWLMTVAVR